MRDNPHLDATAGAMLAATADRLANHEAIVATGARVPYRDFCAEARRFARALLALGVQRGDTVPLWLPDRPTWRFTRYGAASDVPRTQAPHGDKARKEALRELLLAEARTAP
jgi:fatty-acyl-CoA synthase